ncbi:endoplasmic reticulum membrane sensor NFE2L1-like [Genypterus blacodes]|uniref:endoplasmic reticulum membrane sensor NFE2L1-like n=1 Tax=Genypterus blacodes TaxID=154954 RepID=UPI003F7662F4
MRYLKKYFTEGLIQMAILLSLSGIRVDVGLDPYLPPTWHEMLLGSTSALTQTEFYNLRNHQENGHTLHPKNVDLDGFFTARRLLGWVHSLDRLQVPNTAQETWLVHWEPDSLPGGHPDQPSSLQRAATGVDRDHSDQPMEPSAVLGTMEDEEEDVKEEGTHPMHYHNVALDETGHEGDEEEEEVARIYRCDRRREGHERPVSQDCISNELTQSEAAQICDGVLDDGGRRGDLEQQPTDRELHLSHDISTDNPSLDLELQWQDLMALMAPEYTSIAPTTSSENAGRLQDACSEDLYSSNNMHEAGQDVVLLDDHLHHVLLRSPHRSDAEAPMLSLTPSAELDGGNGSVSSDAMENINMNPLHSPPDNIDLLSHDPSSDFSMNADTNTSSFTMNLLTQDPPDNIDSSLCYPDNCDSFRVDFRPCDLASPSSSPSLESNVMTHDLSASPSSAFWVEQEEDEEEGDLRNPLSDILESVILEEMSLLDLALEEGFSPEMTARLEEEGYFNRERTQQGTGAFSHNITSVEDRHSDHSGSRMADAEQLGYPGSQHQDLEDEDEDSDSGLSLNFTHSPASPCASEASSYSSSSSSSSSSVSAVGSPFSEEDDAEEGLLDSIMEVELTIKQEEQDVEEEMGAAGGSYSKDVQELLFSGYQDQKLLNGFPWLEHIDHDHTYNQPPSPSASASSLAKLPTKHSKSSSRYHNAHPYSSKHITETKMWGRDERRARAMKIPFSTELIVNLPVEEFNELLTSHCLNEEQLTLIRDIRRRGKNKIAAQNCRQRKMDVLSGLQMEVSGLRCHRSRLLREKQKSLRTLQEIKRQLDMLYQQVFSSLRDQEGRPLDATEHILNFGPNGNVTVASRQQRETLPPTGDRMSKKQRDKKK